MDILKIGKNEAFYRIDGERVMVMLPFFQVGETRPKTKVLWRTFDLPYCGRKGEKAIIVWRGETLSYPLEITLMEADDGRAYFEVKETKGGKTLKFPVYGFVSLNGLIETAVEIFKEADNLDEIEEWDEDLLL